MFFYDYQSYNYPPQTLFPFAVDVIIGTPNKLPIVTSIERIGLAYMVVYYAVHFAVYKFCHRYKAFEHPRR